MKPKLFKIFSIIMILSMMVVPATAQAPTPGEPAERAAPAAEAQFTGNYIVMLKEPAVTTYAGGVAGLAATSIEEGQKLNSRTPAVKAYVGYLDGYLDKFVATLEKSFGREVQQYGRTHYLQTGIVLKLSEAEALRVERMPEVFKVFKETIEYVDTDAGPTWIGAPGIWDGSAVPGNMGYMGEGILVGMIDSGINSDHPSFADVGGDNYDHDNPFGSGAYFGVCDSTDPSYDPTFVCNDKLIGAYEYAALYAPVDPDIVENPSPEDEIVGHGSHTSSTTAGNVVTATMIAPTTAYTATISGVAPHANIIMYDACSYRISNGTGPCWGGALYDSVDQAFADGVDVVNYSIGGGNDPAADYVEYMFGLMAVYNNTFISTSAGNSGPTASTVNHRSPWVSATAASTHNRQFANDLIDMSGGDTSAPADMVGKGFTAGLVSTPIVYAGDYVTSTLGTPDALAARLCAPNYFAPNTFSGEIVVCDRGTYGRVAKSAEVARVGAGGYVIANDSASGASLVADAFPIPGVHITYADGVVLKTWMASGSGHMAAIAGNYADIDPIYGDITASFSSRGPNTTFDVLKPDISAPGVDIFAAIYTSNPSDPPEYNLLGGTSMASPHNAGASALLKNIFPTMHSSRIRSAMMLTSQPYVLTAPGGFTVNASGAGRVDLSKAALTGLVLHQSFSQMFNAVYAGTGQDYRTFNLASIMDTQCVVECSWTRTFTSNLPFTATYTATFETWTTNFDATITPAVFELGPGATQVVEFTMDASQIPVGAYAEGMAWFETDATFPTLMSAPFGGEDVSDAHLPILVRSKASSLPASVLDYSGPKTGSFTLNDIISVDAPTMTVMTYGLAEGLITMEDLPVDPTNGTPYDFAAGGVFSTTVTVPAGAKRLVAEIVSSTSADLDMWVGLDDGDGIPESGEVKCTSATGAVLEYCNFTNPVAGTYWVLVMNYNASSVGAIDPVELSVGVVGGTDVGNMVVTAPASAVNGVPWDISVDYEPGSEAPRFYGAFSVGTTPLTPGDLGTVLVDIHMELTKLYLPLILR